MKTIRVLDKSGDTSIEFGTPETAEQEAKAKEVFEAWMEKKHPAYLTNRADGKEDMPITSFDQIEEGAEAILFRPITAG